MRKRLGGRPKDERGAVLVETSIAFLFLFLLSAGVLEYGGMIATQLDTVSAVRSGARTGSTTTASGPGTDREIVNALLVQAGQRRQNIDRVVIYKASSANAEPSAACKNTSTGAAPAGESCNVYQKADFNLPDTAFANLASAKRWPASARIAGVDYVGIWVQINRTPLIKLVPSVNQITDHFTMRIEPPTSTFTPVDWGTGNEYEVQGDKSWFCWEGWCPPWACDVDNSCPPPDPPTDDDGSDEGDDDDDDDDDDWEPPKANGKGGSA